MSIEACDPPGLLAFRREHSVSFREEGSCVALCTKKEAALEGVAGLLASDRDETCAVT